MQESYITTVRSRCCGGGGERFAILFKVSSEKNLEISRDRQDRYFALLGGEQSVHLGKHRHLAGRQLHEGRRLNFTVSLPSLATRSMKTDPDSTMNRSQYSNHLRH